MISSSSEGAPCILDTMLIVYSLLEGHPASTACEQFIRAETQWHTNTLVLFEAKAVLTKIYGVGAALASEKIGQFARGSVVILSLDAALAAEAFALEDELRIDLTDATLLQTARTMNARLVATDDGRLAATCRDAGLDVATPIVAALRPEIAAWEEARLPVKGLPRILSCVHQWLQSAHSDVASEFWSACGRGSHLP